MANCGNPSYAYPHFSTLFVQPLPAPAVALPTVKCPGPGGAVCMPAIMQENKKMEVYIFLEAPFFFCSHCKVTSIELRGKLQCQSFERWCLYHMC